MKTFKFHFILIFLLGNLFQFNQLQAQVGFSKEFSGSFALYSSAVTVCADGGYAIAYHNSFGGCWLIKTDSNGVLLWKKNYIIPPPFDYNVSFELIATPDSGFLYSILVYHPMLGYYSTTVINKLDQHGNIQNNTQSNSGTLGFSGNDIPFHNYNRLSKTISSLVFHYSYDGFSSYCCPSFALVHIDSALNISSQYRIANPISEPYGFESRTVTEIFNNSNSLGYAVTMLESDPNYKSKIIFLGSGGNILWQKKFQSINFHSSVQIGNHIYFLSYSNFPRKLFLHKLDLQGNIIFSKAFNISDLFYAITMVPSQDSTLFISSGKYSYIQQKHCSVIMEVDTSGNVIQAYNSLDSATIQSSYIDSNQGIFLFTKKYSTNNNAFQFDKVYLSSNSCNMAPLSISTYDTIIANSTAASYVAAYNLNMLPPSITTDTVVTLTAITHCSPLAINNHSFSNNDLKIYPNPVSDILHIELENRYNTSLQIQVTDILGRRIHENQFVDSDYDLPVSEMKKGIYFLTVSGKDILENRKFLVQ